MVGQCAPADHAGMRKIAKTSPRTPRRPDYWGAFCFVVLVATVLYAAVTAAPG